MLDKELKYYTFQDILEFLSFNFEFEKKNPRYPFNNGKENVEFSWGQVIIPKYGIREMVQNKISDIKEKPLSEIKMVYSIPFNVKDGNFGNIYKNISLTFRYDKEYKYGDINKSIYEVCFWILDRAIATNDFYIIPGDIVQEFMSYCVCCNQYGLGSLVVGSAPTEHFKKNA